MQLWVGSGSTLCSAKGYQTEFANQHLLYSISVWKCIEGVSIGRSSLAVYGLPICTYTLTHINVRPYPRGTGSIGALVGGYRTIIAQIPQRLLHQCFVMSKIPGVLPPIQGIDRGLRTKNPPHWAYINNPHSAFINCAEVGLDIDRCITTV